MKIRIILVVSAFLLVPIVATAQVPSYWLFDDAGSSEIERRLDRQVDFEFAETPLTEVIEHIRKVSDVPCVIKLSALDAVGLDTNVPVTFRGRAIRIRDGLRMMLSEIELTWTIESRHLVITTPEDAEQNLATKVYDVRHFIEATWLPVVRQTESGATETAYDYSCDFRWLVELITSTIRPTTWGYVGGPGSVNGIANRRMRALVVCQTGRRSQGYRDDVPQLSEATQ